MEWPNEIDLLLSLICHSASHTLSKPLLTTAARTSSSQLEERSSLGDTGLADHTYRGGFVIISNGTGEKTWLITVALTV
jgi:hypothetical protein